MQNQKLINVDIDNKTYNVLVIYKRQRGIYLRYKNNQFVCTCPKYVSNVTLIDFFKKGIPSLNKKLERYKKKEEAKGNNYTYILGEKYERVFSNDELFNVAYETFYKLTRKYENIMGIKNPYNIRIKKLKRIYGSNSIKTHTISYNIDLIHYSEEIISSVVIHELAHHFYRDHQKGFHKCLLTYCPNYNILRNRLIRGMFK